jgi:hypothetical protein
MRIVPALPSHIGPVLRAGRERVTRPAGLYAAVLSQLAVSEAFSFFEAADDAAPVAVAGIAYPPGAPAEVWFLVARDAARRNLLGLVRALRLGLSARAAFWPHGITCFVHWRNEPGQRLVRLTGFAPDPYGPVYFGHHRWIMPHGAETAGSVERP